MRLWSSLEGHEEASVLEEQLLGMLNELAEMDANANANDNSESVVAPAPVSVPPKKEHTEPAPVAAPTLVIHEAAPTLVVLPLPVEKKEEVKAVVTSIHSEDIVMANTEDATEEEEEEEEEVETEAEEDEEEAEEEEEEEEEADAEEEVEETKAVPKAQEAEEDVEMEVEVEEEEVVEPEAEEEEIEVEEEEEAGMEVEQIFIRGRAYWLETNTQKLYAVTSDDDVGDEVGKMVNGKPLFLAK
jgi:hypothetical protein